MAKKPTKDGIKKVTKKGYKSSRNKRPQKKSTKKSAKFRGNEVTKKKLQKYDTKDKKGNKKVQKTV